ncbi:MAG: GHKL domain-containing protein [Lachnospiraceae bacterium]|nr:GHKL domain-containing protein [Lachnospiraceae bacterium]
MKLKITIAEIIIIQLSAFWISEYRDFRTLFTGITSSVYILFGNIFCAAIYMVTENNLWALAGQVLIHGALMGVLNWKIRPYYMMDMKQKGWFWKGLWLIPSLYYGIIYFLVVWPQNIRTSPENLGAVVLVLLQIVLSYGIILRMFAQKRMDYELRCSNKFLENYAERIRHEADIIQAKEGETAMLRHDMRHYARLLEVYLANGETEKIYELTDQVNQRLDATVSKRYCENISVNGVLGFCEDLARKKQVRFLAEVEIPKQVDVNEIELAAVISNLLENGIAAAAQVQKKEERYVKVCSHCVRKQIIIEVSNSFAGEREISAKTGLPISRNGEGHGYGMMSVQAFARKNNAVFDYSVEKNVFQVRILAKQAN